jgi:hypothetical protein
MESLGKLESGSEAEDASSRYLTSAAV